MDSERVNELGGVTQPMSEGGSALGDEEKAFIARSVDSSETLSFQFPICTAQSLLDALTQHECDN